MEQPLETFRMSFLCPYLWVMAWSLPLGIAAVIADELPTTKHWPVLSIVLAIATIVAAAIGAGLVAAVNFVFPVHVYRGGLRGFNTWARPRSLAWTDMESVRSFNGAGLRYVRIYSHESAAVLWLPLFLIDRNRFEALVIQLANPENPLARFFLTNDDLRAK